MPSDDGDTDEERSEARAEADDAEGVDADDAAGGGAVDGPGPEDRPGSPDPRTSDRQEADHGVGGGTYVNGGREATDRTRGQAWNAQGPESRGPESRGPPGQSPPRRRYGSHGSPPSHDQPRRYGSRPSGGPGGPEGAGPSRSSDVPIGGMRGSGSGRKSAPESERSRDRAEPSGRTGESPPPAEGARPPVEGGPAPERTGSAEPGEPSDAEPRGSSNRRDDAGRSADEPPKRTQPIEEPSDVESGDDSRADADEGARSGSDEPSDPPKYGGPRDPNWERKRNRTAANQHSQREHERRMDRQLDRQRDFQVDKSGGRYRRK